jgi:hypothetical protein
MSIHPVGSIVDPSPFRTVHEIDLTPAVIAGPITGWLAWEMEAVVVTTKPGVDTLHPHGDPERRRMRTTVGHPFADRTLDNPTILF